MPAEQKVIGVHEAALAHRRHDLPEGDIPPVPPDPQPLAAGGYGPGSDEDRLSTGPVKGGNLADQAGHHLQVEAACAGSKDVGADLNDDASGVFGKAAICLSHRLRTPRPVRPFDYNPAGAYFRLTGQPGASGPGKGPLGLRPRHSHPPAAAG